MKFYLIVLLLSFLEFSSSKEVNTGGYQVIPSNLSRKECISLRESQKVPNNETMLCIARAMANSALKAFHPVENKCDSNLNIDPTGKPCYSVRAWSSYSKDSNANEHVYSQSLFLSMYYGLSDRKHSIQSKNIKNIELTLENPLSCYAIYKPSKRLSHGRGSGSTFTISNIAVDSTKTDNSVKVTAGYESPFADILGGVEAELSVGYSWSNTKGQGQGSSMVFEVPDNATCEPYLYQSALMCNRQSGKLKVFYKDGTSNEIQLKKESKKWLLMPLDENHSDYFISIIGCVGRK